MICSAVPIFIRLAENAIVTIEAQGSFSHRSFRKFGLSGRIDARLGRGGLNSGVSGRRYDTGDVTMLSGGVEKYVGPFRLAYTAFGAFLTGEGSLSHAGTVDRYYGRSEDNVLGVTVSAGEELEHDVQRAPRQSRCGPSRRGAGTGSDAGSGCSTRSASTSKARTTHAGAAPPGSPSGFDADDHQPNCDRAACGRRQRRAADRVCRVADAWLLILRTRRQARCLAVWEPILLEATAERPACGAAASGGRRHHDLSRRSGFTCRSRSSERRRRV